MNPFENMIKTNLRNLNNVSKIMLVVLVVIISYFLLFLITSSLLAPRQTPMMEMMGEIMGTSIMSFSTTNSIIINLVSLVFAVVLGFLAALYLFRAESENKEYDILRKALSEDEKKILDEVKIAGEITQDSLRFRLDWSKAKVSTILTNLDKRGLIQRERTGKTYKVYLQKKVI